MTAIYQKILLSLEPFSKSQMVDSDSFSEKFDRYLTLLYTYIFVGNVYKDCYVGINSFFFINSKTARPFYFLKQSQNQVMFERKGS